MVGVNGLKDLGKPTLNNPLHNRHLENIGTELFKEAHIPSIGGAGRAEKLAVGNFRNCRRGMGIAWFAGHD